MDLTFAPASLKTLWTFATLYRLKIQQPVQRSCHLIHKHGRLNLIIQVGSKCIFAYLGFSMFEKKPDQRFL